MLAAPRPGAAASPAHRPREGRRKLSAGRSPTPSASSRAAVSEQASPPSSSELAPPALSVPYRASRETVATEKESRENGAATEERASRGPSRTGR